MQRSNKQELSEKSALQFQSFNFARYFILAYVGDSFCLGCHAFPGDLCLSLMIFHAMSFVSYGVCEFKTFIKM